MKPERKIVAAAIATIVLWILQVVTTLEIPIGIEGAIATIAGYLIPEGTNI